MKNDDGVSMAEWVVLGAIVVFLVLTLMQNLPR